MYQFKKSFLVAALLSTGLGVDARSLWSSHPATHGPKSSDDYILKTSYPIGNGRLGAMPFGPPGRESLAMNVDSLWSGGPFESSTYSGGNPSTSKAGALPDIRSWIFNHGTGNVSELLGSGNNYGSYRALGNLTIGIDHGSSYKTYKRSLDLETAMHKTTYQVDDAEFTTTAFCSFPGDICVYNVASDKALPAITVQFENALVAENTVNASCSNRQARFTGVTQLGPPVGMKFDAIARVTGGRIQTNCKDGALTVTPAEGAKSVTFVIGAGTDFDQKHGTAEYDYSFRGEDPAAFVEKATAEAAVRCYKDIVSDHVADYKALFEAFKLDLPDTKGSGEKETSDIISGYSSEGTGDPFVEALLFDYSRYMLITSSRENSLPANLQGRWTEENNPSWSADYHANINLQMNYWAADQTGLSKTQGGLWKYMIENWAPRGSETAELLYGGKGWVVHNEMNIFGHTAMKGGTGWANYPAAAAWMMQHVWDNFDYTQDVDWLRSEGYPLLKGTAEFWLSQLQKDEFFNDGTLVVNPCNSPEHGPTTFGCTHYQQLIFQVFETTLAAGAIVSESDAEFTKQLTASLESLDTGLHFTEWGGIKEWKLPDSFGYDTKNTHRHLSNLVGWHPGYSISSYESGYTNSTIQGAIEETLKARGNGNGADANAGWAKVWRSACWARLNNTEQAHFELRYAIDLNFANNGFSMYNGLSAPLQIDANFGFGGAVLSMLAVDLPQRHGSTEEARTVVLGPAIPASWGGGSVKGLRLRGGNAVAFSWGDDGKVNKASLTGNGKPVTLVNVDGKVLGG